MAIHPLKAKLSLKMEQELAAVLPIDEDGSAQILSHANNISLEDACSYLYDLLGDSEEVMSFLDKYRKARASRELTAPQGDGKNQSKTMLRTQRPDSKILSDTDRSSMTPSKDTSAPRNYDPPPGLPPVHQHTNPVIEAGRVRARDEVSSLYETDLVANL